MENITVIFLLLKNTILARNNSAYLILFATKYFLWKIDQTVFSEFL